jgi:hypothetical protein
VFNRQVFLTFWVFCLEYLSFGLLVVFLYLKVLLNSVIYLHSLLYTIPFP